MKFRCELLTWSGISVLVRKLAQRIEDSGYEVEAIVGVARGGLVPATLLSDYLRLKQLLCIKVEHWGITATPDERAKLTVPLGEGFVREKRVLLVDDLTDTGETLEVGKRHLLELKAGEVRTAALLHKGTSRFRPDYYVKALRKWRWVIFPWNYREDFSNLLRNSLGDGWEERIKAASVEELREVFRKDYGLNLSRAFVAGISELLCE